MRISNIIQVTCILAIYLEFRVTIFEILVTPNCFSILKSLPLKMNGQVNIDNAFKSYFLRAEVVLYQASDNWNRIPSGRCMLQYKWEPKTTVTVQIYHV